MKFKYFYILAMLFLTGFLSACNTIEGAGQDIEAGGEKIQKTADDVKNKM